MKTAIMDYFVLTAAVVMAVCTVWGIIGTVRTRRKLRSETEKIKLSRNMKYVKTSLICNIISAVLCAIVVGLDAYDIHEIKIGAKDSDYSAYSQTETLEEFHGRLLDSAVRHFRIWALLGICWAISAAFRTDELINGKYVYLTDKNVYISDRILPAEKYRYIINDETLLLYYRKQKIPAEYTVTEDKELLIATLEDNYTPYSNVEVKEQNNE